MERRNATYLTEQFPGKEESFWTPCIFNFLKEGSHESLELPISEITDYESEKGPWYGPRKGNDTLRIDKNNIIETEVKNDDLLITIGQHFNKDLFAAEHKEHLCRFMPEAGMRCNIWQIRIDILIIHAGDRGKSVTLIENKPYDGSTFDGNQGPRQSYPEFVMALNDALGIPCQYLVIHSIGCDTLFRDLKGLQDDLGKHGTRFGSLLLEDVFLAMGNYGYKCDPITISNDWLDYCEKGADYAV